MDIRKQLDNFSSLVKAEGDVLSFNVKFKITNIDYLGDNQEELDMTQDGLIFHFGSDDEIVVFADLHSVGNMHNVR